MSDILGEMGAEVKRLRDNRREQDNRIEDLERALARIEQISKDDKVSSIAKVALR